MGLFKLPKIERLSKKKSIQELFEKGSSFYLYPFKTIYLSGPVTQAAHQVIVSVSKRNFKKAVDRNLIKRRMREAFRLNKSLIAGTSKFQIVYIYTAKEALPFSQLQEKMVQTFKRLPQ
jgi:ribonuclease P protein component